MALVKYRKLSTADLVGLDKVARHLQHLQTEVKPQGSEYVAIQEMMQNMNVLAACAGADLFFKPAGAATAYPDRS